MLIADVVSASMKANIFTSYRSERRQAAEAGQSGAPTLYVITPTVLTLMQVSAYCSLLDACECRLLSP